MKKPSAEAFAEIAAPGSSERWLLIRYGLLTLFLFVPLLLAFAFVRNLYPFAASTMMMGGGDLESGQTYYVMRGETVSGELIDLPPVDLTNALANNTWSLVAAIVNNKSFSIAPPHPENAALIAAAGDTRNLPPARRLDDLLRSWGTIYNSRLSSSSPQRLRAVRLDAYRWEGGVYSNYDRLSQSWRVQL
jgi:hypothetical protein